MTADDKEFNPFEFTASVSAALRTGDVDKAKEIVQLTIAKGTLSPTNYRATNAQNLIRAVEEQHLRIGDLTAGTSAEHFDVIYAKARALNAVLGIPPYLNRKSERGRYETRIPANPVVMTHKFSDVPSDELSLLETAGFCKPAALHEASSIFVERDCRVSALGGDDMTIVTDEGFYHPRRSSRVAKVSHSIALRKPEGRLPEAFILPFAHSAANYYHGMIETMAGLRYLHLVGETVPILYDVDRFGFLPVFAEMMNIDPARFVPCGHVANKVITCAYLPDINPFYWSGDLSAFFRAMAARTFPMPRKEIRFYLSRQKSTRADSYEEQLQCELEKRGFLIIHAQELSVREQVELFASASCIIAPHGAGLANTIFCRSEVKVIEIFNTSIVSPDFCQRLKYVTRDYHPVVNLNDRAVGRVLDLIS